MKDSIENLFQKGKTEKPPASLDNFILAQAKNSCDEKQSSASKSNRNKWLYSLSSAAVVVLSFSVIFNLQNENMQISDQPMMLERPSIENNVDKEENDANFKRSAKKVIHDPVPESPLVVTEAESVEVYEESVESQVPVASGLSMQDNNRENNTSNNDETKSVATSQPKAITPAPKKAMDEASSKEEEQAPFIQAPKMTQSIEREIQQSDYSTQNDDSENLDKITVTGSRLMIEPISDDEDTFNSAKENKKELSFTQQLEQLGDLIKDKKFEEAKQMLKQLQKSYPYYDFSKYKKILD